MTVSLVAYTVTVFDAVLGQGSILKLYFLSQNNNFIYQNNTFVFIQSTYLCINELHENAQLLVEEQGYM